MPHLKQVAKLQIPGLNTDLKCKKHPQYQIQINSFYINNTQIVYLKIKCKYIVKFRWWVSLITEK